VFGSGDVLQGVVDRAIGSGQAGVELFGAQPGARFEVLDIIHPAGMGCINMLRQEKRPGIFFRCETFSFTFWLSLEIAVERWGFSRTRDSLPKKYFR